MLRKLCRWIKRILFTGRSGFGGTVSVAESKPITTEEIALATERIETDWNNHIKEIGRLYGMKIVLDESLPINEYRLVVGKGIWKKVHAFRVEEIIKRKETSR